MFVGDATASNGTDGAGEMRVSQSPTGRPKDSQRMASRSVCTERGCGIGMSRILGSVERDVDVRLCAQTCRLEDVNRSMYMWQGILYLLRQVVTALVRR